MINWKSLKVTGGDFECVRLLRHFYVHFISPLGMYYIFEPLRKPKSVQNRAHKWEKDVKEGVKKDFKHISLFIAELKTFLLLHELMGVCYRGSDSWVSPLDHIRTQSHAKVLLTSSPMRRTCYSASMVSENGLVLWRSSVGKREKVFLRFCYFYCVSLQVRK